MPLMIGSHEFLSGQSPLVCACPMKLVLLKPSLVAVPISELKQPVARSAPLVELSIVYVPVIVLDQVPLDIHIRFANVLFEFNLNQESVQEVLECLDPYRIGVL